MTAGLRCGLFALRSVAEATEGNFLYLDAKLNVWDTSIIINVVRFNNKFSRYATRDLKSVKIKQNGFFPYYNKNNTVGVPLSRHVYFENGGGIRGILAG